MIKIDKDIPIPDKCPNDGRGRKVKYPFRQMEVGDSFLYEEPFSQAAQAKLHSCAYAFKKNNPEKKNWKFTVRKVEGDKIRVWRIK